MTLALKKYILQGEIIQFSSNEGITDIELSVLCTWAFPLRGHLECILSFRESSIKYTMNIQAKRYFAMTRKKETMAGKKCAANCCCVQRREPTIFAERLGSEATKETCSRTPVSHREQFVRSRLFVQRCSSHVLMLGKAQRSHCSPPTPHGATMCFRM